MTDAQFNDALRKMMSGDRQGLADIYNEYYKLVYSAALSVTCCRADAEDAVSDLFVKLWLGVSGGKIKFDPDRQGHKRWLAVCAKNTAVNITRRRRNEESLEAGDSDQPAAAEPADTKQESEMLTSVELKDALGKLAEGERMVFHLKHFAGYTLREIAEILSIPPGTAASRCRSAEEKLRSLMKEAFMYE
ncbi:MAG: sigma-70 family RNA polymerase sigma factor [Oscillospiraceae bacterium]|nr:sigma-70 family RNA polymerase sigma factor [Oscillospiraceae bacterium]